MLVKASIMSSSYITVASEIILIVKFYFSSADNFLKYVISLWVQYLKYTSFPKSLRGLSGVPILFSKSESSYEKFISNFP